MTGLLTGILALIGIAIIFFFLLKGIVKKDHGQFKKALVTLLATCVLLILITAAEFILRGFI